MTEYEASVSFDLGVSFECLGKPNLSKIQKLLKDTLVKELEKDENITEVDIYNCEFDADYEKIE